jgi:hypothetical protein
MTNVPSGPVTLLAACSPSSAGPLERYRLTRTPRTNRCRPLSPDATTAPRNVHFSGEGGFVAVAVAVGVYAGVGVTVGLAVMLGVGVDCGGPVFVAVALGAGVPVSDVVGGIVRVQATVAVGVLVRVAVGRGDGGLAGIG